MLEKLGEEGMGVALNGNRIGNVHRYRLMKEIPIWEKSNLTLEEAAAYSGIGINKIREISNAKNCDFVLWIGNKRLIKRQRFDRFIDQAYTL